MGPLEKRWPVSACVNCRDDEMTIGRWIEAVRHHVAQIVICDTGSRDATREIILGSGLENLVLLERPWTGFLDARNRFFDVASEDFLLQLDVDEVLLDGFWRKLPEYLRHLSKRRDSIRLDHYSAKFQFSSFEDLNRNAERFDDHFVPFSYPRDVLYRCDLKRRGVLWRAFGGRGEIFNNLDTRRYLRDREPLIHCYPPHHKVHNPEYHARKILTYAKLTPGYWEPGWTRFLDDHFTPEKQAEMRREVFASQEPAPHAAWWGETGRFQDPSAGG